MKWWIIRRNLGAWGDRLRKKVCLLRKEKEGFTDGWVKIMLSFHRMYLATAKVGYIFDNGDNPLNNVQFPFVHFVRIPSGD